MNAGTSELTIINHNLSEGGFVKVTGAQGISSLNDIIFIVNQVVDEDTVILDVTFTGTYTGGGKLTRVSNINITSKQWNPGTPVGQQFRIPFIDFLLDRTTNGEVSVNYFIDTTSGSSIQDQVGGDTLLGNNTLFTRPEDNATYQPNQVRIWHRYFLQTQGQTLQIKIFMSEDQMKDATISQSDFQLDGLLLYVQPEGRITG